MCKFFNKDVEKVSVKYNFKYEKKTCVSDYFTQR